MTKSWQCLFDARNCMLRTGLAGVFLSCIILSSVFHFPCLLEPQFDENIIIIEKDRDYDRLVCLLIIAKWTSIEMNKNVSFSSLKDVSTPSPTWINWTKINCCERKHKFRASFRFIINSFTAVFAAWNLYMQLFDKSRSLIHWRHTSCPSKTDHKLLQWVSQGSKG